VSARRDRDDGERMPRPETAAGQVVDAALHLLDRQVLDRDGTPITTVDDLELSDIALGEPIDHEASAPVITAILTGPVLATRIFGGRPPASRWERIPWRLVAEIGVVVRLGSVGTGLDAAWTERWVRDHIIRRIPGGRHDPG
jgi:sporulation protein YlmC with PRC-barrel domain